MGIKVTEIESAALTILLMFSMGFINILLMKIFYYPLSLKTNDLVVIFAGILEIVFIEILLKLSLLCLGIGVFFGIGLLPIIGAVIGGFGVIAVLSIFLSGLLINKNLKLSLQGSWKIGKWFLLLVFVIIILYVLIILTFIMPLPFMWVSSIIIIVVPVSIITSICMNENTIISWRSFGLTFFSLAIVTIIYTYIPLQFPILVAKYLKFMN